MLSLPTYCQVDFVWTHFNQIWIKMKLFSLKKMHVKMSSAKCRPFCSGLSVCSKRKTKIEWLTLKPRVVMMPTLSSLVPPVTTKLTSWRHYTSVLHSPPTWNPSQVLVRTRVTRLTFFGVWRGNPDQCPRSTSRASLYGLSAELTSHRNDGMPQASGWWFW